MPKQALEVPAGEYALVADRIVLFYEKYPEGCIHTRILQHTAELVIVRAAVYRSPDDERAAATGLASERFGDGEINTVACLENTETSAVGRALANLGFTASRQRPSAEEMAKVSRARARQHHSHAPVQIEDRQQLADAVSDALRMLDCAVRLGARPARADSLRSRLLAGDVPIRAIERLEHVLRVWIARRERRVKGASLHQESAP